MTGPQLRAILILPANVLGTIPLVLFWWEGGLPPRLASPAATLLAGACFTLGIGLMATTIRLFHERGRGSLAPWSPTQELVVRGPYRHVRNPMISGVLFNLAGLALAFGSPAVGTWFGIFLLGNAVYIPLAEEPGLEARFGHAYREYRAHVPRWIPRLSPWPPDSIPPGDSA